MKSLIDSLLRIFVAALLAGATVVAVASDARGQYTVFGHGLSISCGELVDAYNKDTFVYKVAQSWITGYTTATGRWNNTQKPLGDVAELDGMMLIIRQHCRNNPLDDIADAAEFMAVQVLEKANE